MQLIVKLRDVVKVRRLVVVMVVVRGEECVGGDGVDRAVAG